MRRRRSDRWATFSPLRDKTLFSALRQLFINQFGYADKLIFAEAMIERILATIEAFVAPRSMLQPGQLLWMAVARDGHKHVMKHMRDIPQVPVILDLISDQDLQELSDSTPFPAVRKHRHARLVWQAYEQGGVLAQSDLAAISLRHHRTVHDDLNAIRMEHGRTLPYRGAIEDIGATTSHKAEVVRLLEAGYPETDICHQLDPHHDLSSVENYAQSYKKVTKLVERGFSPEEISGILGLGLRTVATYIELVQEYHPELAMRNPYLEH